MFKTVDFEKVKMFLSLRGRVFYQESLKFLPNPIPLLAPLPVNEGI